MNNQNELHASIIYIDDTPEMANDAICDELREIADEFLFFSSPEQAMDFIGKNIEKTIVVILDWRFNQGQQGDEIMNSIHEISMIVPVIIFTGQSIDVNETYKMFKGQAFSCLSKSASSEDVISTICSAYETVQRDIRTVIVNWISQEQNADADSFICLDNQSYSLNDIRKSIYRQGELGVRTTEDILKLATELFFRNGKI